MSTRPARARRVRHSAFVFAIGVALAACGERAGPGLTADGVIGSYEDGSGRTGIAVVATLHDAVGAGPASPWSVTLLDEAGPVAVGTYDAPGAASSQTFLWPQAPLRRSGRYVLSFTDGRYAVRTPLAMRSVAPLASPAPTLDGAATRISWVAVDGATRYACRVHADGALVLEREGAATSCDVSALPPGAYAASILALREPVGSLIADAADATLRLDVAEARLSFVRPTPGAAVVVARAAGGAFDFGGAAPGLAIWLSLGAPDGTATTSAWSVAVTGPQLPADAPLEFTYHASFPRQLVWSYDVPATPGTYWLTATSSDLAIATTFTVGAPAALDFPLDVVATAGQQGTASVTWSEVAGARAYLVEVWDSTAGAAATSEWVTAPPAQFPKATFTVGHAYEVRVAATDADVVGGAVPTQVSISEYPYLPGSFVAP